MHDRHSRHLEPPRRHHRPSASADHSPSRSTRSADPSQGQVAPATNPSDAVATTTNQCIAESFDPDADTSEVGAAVDTLIREYRKGPDRELDRSASSLKPRTMRKVLEFERERSREDDAARLSDELTR